MYAFIYPNLAINRYGPWMDTNVVVPTGPESCTVHFDWWLEDHLCHDTALIERSIAESEKVSWQGASCPSAETGCLNYGCLGQHLHVQCDMSSATPLAL